MTTDDPFALQARKLLLSLYQRWDLDGVPNAASLDPAEVEIVRRHFTATADAARAAAIKDCLKHWATLTDVQFDEWINDTLDAIRAQAPGEEGP